MLDFPLCLFRIPIVDPLQCFLNELRGVYSSQHCSLDYVELRGVDLSRFKLWCILRQPGKPNLAFLRITFDGREYQLDQPENPAGGLYGASDEYHITEKAYELLAAPYCAELFVQCFTQVAINPNLQPNRVACAINTGLKTHFNKLNGIYDHGSQETE